ncbi:MAG: 2-phospho-L-lactate guanylyltransferase [Solirubrobacteraceae bacterium]
MRTAAILPVKRFCEAKQRLGDTLATDLRRALARAMVSDVLDALAAAEQLELTIVVTNEESVRETASELGALAIADTAEAGQSAAVALGVEQALRAGAQRVLCVPGDCPALDPQELAQLLGARQGAEAGADAEAGVAEVVIVPDRHGTGTNGLLLSPPDAIAPSFGPGSCERHAALARAAGLPCRIERPSSLLLDVDTGADLAALRQRLSRERLHAPRTRGVLRIEVEQAWPASQSAA